MAEIGCRELLFYASKPKWVDWKWFVVQYIGNSVNLAIFSIFALILNIFDQNQARKSKSIAEIWFRELTNVYSMPGKQNKSSKSVYLVGNWKFVSKFLNFQSIF